MKVYIFGAGASKGSQGRADNAPLDLTAAPLVDELFSKVYKRYANDVFVGDDRIYQLANQVGEKSLEEWLTQEWLKINAPHGNEALAYGRKLFGDIALYIWWMMANISNTYNASNGYHLFLEKLAVNDDKEEQAFINFNYDLLLDKALTKVYGYDLSSTITNYTTLNYLKPHGSVNWFLKRRRTDPILSSVDSTSVNLEVLLNRVSSGYFNGKPIEKKMKVIDPLNKNLESISQTFIFTFDSGDYGYPLVMLPLASKMYELVSDFIQQMNAEFARIFSQASEVYVIGYRANDDIFSKMTMYIRKNTTLHVIGRKDAAKIQDDILQKQPNFQKGKVYTAGFMKFIDQM